MSAWLWRIFAAWAPAAALQLSRNGEEPIAKAGVYVSVLSKRDNFVRRAALRRSWKASEAASVFLLKFTLCLGDDTASDGVSDEFTTFGDLLLLECQDGAFGGQLTHRTRLVMNHYHQFYDNRMFFMQVEDDSFVAWRRLGRRLGHELATFPDHVNMSYMGVLTPERITAVRDPSSPWFQPEEAYGAETYPLYMERAGYILGQDLVGEIVRSGLAKDRRLSNQEQAMGVWVGMLKNRGHRIRFVKLSGWQSQEDASPLAPCYRTWKEYPFLFHHGLDVKDRECLARADAFDKDDFSIEDCLPGCKR
eukprot:TRINITY_DN45506_c0_g1_i1.p1 TRINITY_DN45506_c0_g1~~TRINITY_DN45506_c0_g1_i1.p1  ORF type:complete len:328 (+),score=53.04 TRINITY_DN45506_c0_g1_i1:69-986(+)